MPDQQIPVRPRRRTLQRTLAAITALFALGIGYLWLTFASPYGYNPPEDLPIIEDGTTHSVFVYGTLTHPWVRWLVMGRAGEGEPAWLPGFRREHLDIRPADGAVTEGEIIRVSAGELRSLDRYERLGVRYERVKLELRDGETVWVYRLMDPVLQEISEELQD